MFDGIFGHAKEINPQELEKEISPVLIDGEKIERAFKIVRDLILFTNKRLIFIDKQGATGSKVEYHSIPYEKITHFSVETAGTFDRDAELKVWTSGGHSIEKEFKKGTDIVGVQKTLAHYVLK